LWVFDVFAFVGPKKLYEALHRTSTTPKITLGDAEEVLSESIENKKTSVLVMVEVYAMHNLTKI